jgi:hypothetical protein
MDGPFPFSPPPSCDSIYVLEGNCDFAVTTAYNCMYLRPTLASYTKILQLLTSKYRNLMHAKQLNWAKRPPVFDALVGASAPLRKLCPLRLETL